MTEQEALALYERLGKKPEHDWTGLLRPIKQRKVPVNGPLSVTLTLWGHCPSKKNLWEPNGSGGFRLVPEVKKQISTLTTQALFQWKESGPVEHPELTVKFFVSARRQDQDGMYTTILDCLQEAGVLVNDNIAHNNGRKILEWCELVKESDERVEILVVKR